MYDFLSVLREVFAKDPPLISNNQAQPTPLPLPPKEPLQSQAQRSPNPNQIQSQNQPPVLPPKPGQGKERAFTPPSSYGPPIPPLPSEFQRQPRYSSPPPLQDYRQVNPPYQQMGYQSPPPQEMGSPRLMQQYNAPSAAGPYSQMPPYQNQAPFPSQMYQSASPLAQSPQQFVQKPVPLVDLLSAPLDVTIPSQVGGHAPIPAPPIPPNPEKDALLSAVSQILVGETNRAIDDNKKAVPPLLAQQVALRMAQQRLQDEEQALQVLDSYLDNNERILRATIQQAEKVMKDAAGRSKPKADEILVCPTVVGSQLYALVSDVKAGESVRQSLIKALDRGRVSTDVFVKQTRNLAREEFLKKALVNKIAVGMGLS
jgi:ESCRT-I complex subunit TSG101